MKKPVAPRIAGLFLLYLAVFAFLVVLQFGSRRDFSFHAGAMTVSGHYGETSRGDDPAAGSGGILPEGDLGIFFGGVEFRITAPGGDFAFLRPGGEKERPEILSLGVEGDSAVIRFAGAGEDTLGLVFDSRSVSGRPELRIAGSFGEDYAGIEIPFRLLRNARIQDTSGGFFTVAAGGFSFSFGSSRLDMARRVLIIDTASPVAVYRAVSGEEGFSPEDYVLASAWTEDQYAEQVSQWRDKVFAAWNRTPTASLDNEELISAYIAEAVGRGVYREVVSRIPRSFLDSARRTYVSSPFFGRMTESLRSLSAAEQERLSRLAETASASPGEFLAEPHAVAENAVRGNSAFIDRAVALLSGLEAPALNLLPFIMEASVDLAEYRGGDGLPEPLIEPSLLLIAGALRKDGEDSRVLVFEENAGELTADNEFNLRLGAAMDQYGRLAGREDWAAMGRSLVLSVLAQTDTVGMIPAAAVLDAGGNFIAARETRFSAARLYPYLRLDNLPRAERIAGGIDGWAWTAGSSVGVIQNGDITDISVTFPAGETHYMILRGVRPFAKIQLYGIDYRTDPQFERYDSSGWVYSRAEQTLLLKIKHQNPVEHIVIYTTAASGL